MTKLALAVDTSYRGEAISLADKTSEYVDVYKVGLELFSGVGPSIIRHLESRGEVFLDLKLNDIPATVERAVSAGGNYGVKYMTVHSLGGPKMIEAAVKKAEEFNIQILVVTVLTSLDYTDLVTMGFEHKTHMSGHALVLVKKLTKMAIESGANGFVSSANDLIMLRNQFGEEIFLVTPGIRMAKTDDDQKRVATPEKAIKDGASMLVVGRPIRDAENPNAAAKKFREVIDEQTR